MGLHRLEVMQRRQALLAKISDQREQLAESGVRWQPALHLADGALVAARFLRSHPVLLAGLAGLTGLAGLVVVRRNGLAGVVKGARRVWNAYRYINEFSKKIRPRL